MKIEDAIPPRPRPPAPPRPVGALTTDTLKDKGPKKQYKLDAARYRKLRHHLCPDLCDFMQATVSDPDEFDALVDGLDDEPLL